MLDIEEININDIKPAGYNPRLISPVEFDKLTNSIREYGFVSPIIINLQNMTIIGGHQRYDALISSNNNHEYDSLLLFKRGDIGWVFTKDNLSIPNESYEKGLNLALNKISGEWDYPKLNDLLTELSSDFNFDISLTGFDNLDNLDFEVDLDELDIGDDGTTALDTRASLQLYVSFNDASTMEELYESLMSEGYDCKTYV